MIGIITDSTCDIPDELLQQYGIIFEQVGDSSHLRVAVLHGDSPEEAHALADRIQAEYHPLELLVNITGPVLGINTGPGALALCSYVND